MKLYITYDREERSVIRYVQTLDYFIEQGKTEEEIDALVAKHNEEMGWENIHPVEIDKGLNPLFEFLIGEKGYKSYRKITSVYNKLREIQDELESMRTDTFEMSEWVESALKEVKELVPPEDRDD